MMEVSFEENEKSKFCRCIDLSHRYVFFSLLDSRTSFRFTCPFQASTQTKANLEGRFKRSGFEKHPPPLDNSLTRVPIFTQSSNIYRTKFSRYNKKHVQHKNYRLYFSLRRTFQSINRASISTKDRSKSLQTGHSFESSQSENFRSKIFEIGSFRV